MNKLISETELGLYGIALRLRQWRLDWDHYSQGNSSVKPPSIDEFVKELALDFEVRRISK